MQVAVPYLNLCQEPAEANKSKFSSAGIAGDPFLP